ncbi:MAG: T9SS type A sorting domain-containing protein [Candidatus Zixiibacteriota bacterium]|nr:MAG: T9SS type A sorting domain-containing protein [candidate division Zixibacteria bacterium]
MPRLITFVSLFIAAIVCGSILVADTQPTIQSINKMPLSFTKNMGQWDDRVLFRANAGGATMWFTKEGVTYQFTRRIDSPDDRRGTLHVPAGTRSVPLPEGLDSRLRGNDKGGGNDMERDSIEQLVLTAKFVGANPNPEIIAEGQMEYKCNYFLGNDPAKWHTDVPNYEAITLKDLYPGIDLKYSGRRGNGQAAYEFIAAPGADIARIKVAYEGAESTSLDSDGRLILKTKWGDMTAGIKSPTSDALSGSCAWWTSSSTTSPPDLANGDVRQALVGNSGTLTLSYSTYLGGGGGDRGYDIAVDDGGNAYVIGYTTSSNFPTESPYQTYQDTTANGDVFVTKLSSTGSLIYSTYLGGSGGEGGNGIVVDNSGNAYVTGYTYSSNFPTLNPYQASLQGDYGDVFVTKLSSSGDSLIYSTYVGGGGEDIGNGIAVDGRGNAYVTGLTNSSNFPTLNPYQGTFQDGGYDVFVTKFSSKGNNLIYSTYLGGGATDEGIAIAVDGSGNAYLTGWTSSTDFPTVNPYQSTYHGGVGPPGADVFVTKLSCSGDSLIYSTYLGGSDQDRGYGIAVDGSGSAYVTGYTNSSNFPHLNSYQGTLQDNYDVFVTKLSSSGNSLLYSTYLGGWGNDVGYGIAVDTSGNAYVTGYTSSFNFPTLNSYQTYEGDLDAFVTKLSSSGNSLIYSTYLGGEGSDAGHRIAIDISGNAYVTGQTASSNFPTLNPYQETYQGGGFGVEGNDAFVTKLFVDPAADASDEMTPVSLPEKPALDQNYPNPFNPSTEIGFDLPKPSFVSLDIFDVLGRKVLTLINEHLTAGSKRVQWDGRDNTETEVASGVYFYRLQTGDHVEVRKMVLLK